MREIGIDITGRRSKSVEEFRGQTFDYVVTVCDHAAEVCPVFLEASQRLHIPFEDPAGVRGSQVEREEAFET